MKNIAIIGSTGSIGRQTVNVVQRYPERFRVVALCAGGDGQTFLEQVRALRPEYCALYDERAAEGVRAHVPQGVAFASGKAACAAVAGYDLADTVVVAVSGFAGLEYVLTAVQAKKDIALANKESLVCGGELVLSAVKEQGVHLAPVDSEHSALWQCLAFRRDAPYRRLILTASGGPFRTLSKAELAKVTVRDALKHPTWNMGAKITIDSATLLNKGFEVIEAQWLYNAPPEKIDTVVHPESIVHSLVELEDGAVLAQMSYPSMELPIQLALTYPERFPVGIRPLNLAEIGALHFYPLDQEKFPCFALALQSAKAGGTMPCILNGAGEVAVQSFLRERISFTGIAEIIEEVLSAAVPQRADSFAALVAADDWARRKAEAVIVKRSV